MDLPQASTATKQDSQNTITLTVKENGDIYFNKNVVSIEQLSIALEKVKGDPTMAIIINGDEKAGFGQAIQILDTVRRLGIAKVSIRTEK